jgi:excisionase family DNA binding protein
MNNSSPTNATASSLLAGKITRKQVAAYCGLCVRTIDELTRTGVLGHFRIGKSIRYDLAEVEATLRERFHVQARGGEGCPQPAASKPQGKHQETHDDGGLSTSRAATTTPNA